MNTEARRGVESVPKSARLLNHRERSKWGRFPIPREHGVWAMLLVPLVVSGVLLRFQPLLGFLGLAFGSLFGYLGLSAALDGLRAHLKDGRFPSRFARWALLLSGLGTVCLMVPVVHQPRLFFFAPFLSLVVLSEVLHLRWKRERALLNGALSIVGFSFLLPAAFLLHRGTLWSWPDLAAWVSMLAFFVGSLLFIKACLRGRRDRRLRLACVVFHGLTPLFAMMVQPLLAWAFVPGLLRVIWLFHPRPRPLLLGLTEIGAASAFTGLLLSALG